jgi:hypothetical protein
MQEADWTPLEHVYRVLGFAGATGEDGVFARLVLARIIELVSKPGLAGAGGSRYGDGFLPDRHSAAARLCEGLVIRSALICVEIYLRPAWPSAERKHGAVR